MAGHLRLVACAIALTLTGCSEGPPRSRAQPIDGMTIEEPGLIAWVHALSLAAGDSICVSCATRTGEYDHGATKLLFGSLDQGTWSRTVVLDSTHASECRLLLSPAGRLHALLFPSMQLFEVPSNGQARLRGDLNLPISHILRSADVHFVAEDTLAVVYRLEAPLRGRVVLTHTLLATWTADAQLLDTLWIGSTIRGWEGGEGVALEVGAGGAMIVYSERTRMAIYESQDRHRWARRAPHSSVEGLADNFRVTPFGSDIVLITSGEASSLRAQSIRSARKPAGPLTIPTSGSVYPGPFPESSLDVAVTGSRNVEIAWFCTATAWSPQGGPMMDSRYVVDCAVLAPSGDNLRVANTRRLDFNRLEAATALAFMKNTNEPVLVLATTEDFVKRNKLRICRIPTP